MKILSVLLFVSAFISQDLNAQVVLEKAFLFETSITDISFDLNQTHLIRPSFNVETSSVLPAYNSFLFSSLKLFEGVKYRSVLNQFNSSSIFDQRTYSPTSFSDYNNYLSRNYLIHNSSFSEVW